MYCMQPFGQVLKSTEEQFAGVSARKVSIEISGGKKGDGFAMVKEVRASRRVGRSEEKSILNVRVWCVSMSCEY